MSFRRTDPPDGAPSRSGQVRSLLLAVVVALATLTAAGIPVLTGGASASSGVVFPRRSAVPQRPCSTHDRPETGLQGRVPPADVLSGRAAQGYTCNLRLVGHLGATGGAASFDSYRDCAYVTRALGVSGVTVVDMADPAHPRPTALLATPAMLDPWESLRANAKRGLLVAAGEYKPFIDIYDIRTDCRHPRLLSSTLILPGKGHEGWFSPDGLTYYVSTTRSDGGALGLTPTLFPVDISDPRHPRLLSSWALDGQTHGGFTTEDGTRSYVCQQEAPPDDAMLTLNTSRVARRQPSPQPGVVAVTGLGDNQWCQGAYRVTYRGHPYLIQYGERSGGADCSKVSANWATFGYPRFFDLADPGHPKLVGSALLEVDLPQHCSEVTGEGAVNGFGYSVHHCAPDRLYDPTILACSYWHAGLRVLDIRDPRHPVEIAYFNPGNNGPIGTAARPVVRAEQHEIWFTHDLGGLYVVKFRSGVWPFRNARRCPAYDDHYYKAYNPHSTCRTSSFSGIGKPAPGA